MSSMASAHELAHGWPRTLRAPRRPPGGSWALVCRQAPSRQRDCVSVYFCQREAVEIFMYLTEIEPARKLADLLEFAEHGMTIQPGDPKRQRLAIKMASGSGKRWR